MIIDRSKVMLFIALIGFVVLLWLQEREFNDQVSGRALVVDGDSLKINGERIRLRGIDAPEGRQNCTREGKSWACGRASTKALSHFIRGREVECRGEEFDKHNRLLGICYVGGEEINVWMIRQGWAVTFGGAYKGDEREARRQSKGIWQSEFEMPQAWRRRNSGY